MLDESTGSRSLSRAEAAAETEIAAWRELARTAAERAEKKKAEPKKEAEPVEKSSKAHADKLKAVIKPKVKSETVGNKF